MSFKTRYAAIRNATWIWYLMALFCFVRAVTSYHENGAQFGFSFVLWIAAASGLAFGAGRYKRNQAAKLAAKHRMG